jgi:hypothetical protein
MRFASADEFRLALQYVVAGIPPEPHAVPIALPAASARGFRPSRAAVLMALAPATLAAAFCAVRFLPTTQRPRTTASKPQAAAPIRPAVTAPAVPEAVFVGPPAPPDLLDTPAIARARASRPGQKTGKPAPNYALRFTGAEQPPPPPPVAPRRRETPRIEASAERPVPKVDCILPPPSAQAAAAEDAAAEKPQSGGNRLSRALGKVNPFRKTAKYDTADASPKKD